MTAASPAPNLVLIRVTAPHFVAGMVYDPARDVVVDAAPILKWAVGQKQWVVAGYCRKRRWTHTARLDPGITSANGA